MEYYSYDYQDDWDDIILMDLETEHERVKSLCPTKTFRFVAKRGILPRIRDST